MEILKPTYDTLAEFCENNGRYDLTRRLGLLTEKQGVGIVNYLAAKAKSMDASQQVLVATVCADIAGMSYQVKEYAPLTLAYQPEGV